MDCVYHWPSTISTGSWAVQWVWSGWGARWDGERWGGRGKRREDRTGGGDSSDTCASLESRVCSHLAEKLAAVLLAHLDQLGSVNAAVLEFYKSGWSGWEGKQAKRLRGDRQTKLTAVEREES